MVKKKTRYLLTNSMLYKDNIANKDNKFNLYLFLKKILTTLRLFHLPVSHFSRKNINSLM